MDPLVLLIIVLLVIWASGMAYFPLGGLIHVLLVVVIVVIVIRLLQGRSV